MGAESREKILEAAIEIFSHKGYHGVRMEEIAEKAGLNKAMIYYYFSSREVLHRNILKISIERIFHSVSKAIDFLAVSGDKPTEKLERLSKSYFSIFSEYKLELKIFLESLSDESKQIAEVVNELRQEGKFVDPSKAASLVMQGIEAGEIRPMDPFHILTSIIGMNISFFLMRNMFHTVVGFDEEKQKQFDKERPDMIADILLNGVATGERK